MRLKIVLSVFFFVSIFHLETLAQTLPSEAVIAIENLEDYLNPTALEELKAKDNTALAAYFRQKFSERFFYDYRTFDDRLPHYNSLYQNKAEHQKRALDHLGKYNGTTQWKLPFNYLNGTPVNAYALRHLARQHKMVDIALNYFNGGKNPSHIQYFENQMRSLNTALHTGDYEKIEDGNGVYEAFRSGYRVLNWLWIHNMFLNESEYSDEDQLVTIATLLQHGQHLYERNAQFKSGNHQTRGVSALAMLAILLRDFEGTDLWLERAMLRLSEHLDKEINPDGFQFERSVHYHMSDINNFFYVYQLAQINGVAVDPAWEEKLKGLFKTLVKIAYPDRSAPVLQDDTDNPWGETNDISGAMTLGYLLFEDPEFGYFASNKVEGRVYWFLNSRQIELLENISQQKPTYGSLYFEDTGYYIMREGWENNNKMMIISAGLDDEKPDHQHGDMLGIQAMANGKAILPNYQVRYSLTDFDLFKNSMVKNVALVDDELLGKKWTSNKGGSGFGKFKQLPQPQVIAWESNDAYDFFAGSHNGFEQVGVDYTRQVIYVKDAFWIVKDHFQSDNPHQYKQVWQGHYTHENGPNLLRAVAPDASGHDIWQLYPADEVVNGGARGKQWSVVATSDKKAHAFLTIIYPYRKYNNRIDETTEQKELNDWVINTAEDQETVLMTNLAKEQTTFVFELKVWENQVWMVQAKEETDLFIQQEDDQLTIQSISSQEKTLTVTVKKTGKKTTKTLAPGEHWNLFL